MTRIVPVPHRLALVAALGGAVFAAAVAAQAPRPGAPAAAAPRGPVAPAARPSASLDRVVPLERVIAVVNDEALTQWEIGEQKRVVLGQMRAQPSPQSTKPREGRPSTR